MLSGRSIPCVIDQSGVLHPTNAQPIVVAVLDIQPGQNGDSPSGRLLWNNKVQAFLTLDLTGNIVISFSITDMSGNAHITEQSVRNILNVL